MTYNFGRDIERKLYPEENGRNIALPTQDPTIYLFSAQPSLADALVGTGAIQTITTWNQRALRPFECTYTISAIDDPTPTSATPTTTYWEALIFKLTTGEQDQCIIRAFDLGRTFGAPEQPSVSTADLYDIYPAITAYATEAQLTKHIATAEKELRKDLKNNGFEWSRIGNLADLHLALAYKAISMVAFSQIVELNDKFDIRHKKFESDYQSQLNTIILRVDVDGDGIYETTEAASIPFVINVR